MSFVTGRQILNTKAIPSKISLARQIRMAHNTRHFAPLDPASPNTHNAPTLKGIIFDVDGTLCKPQNYMFKQMREVLAIPKTTDILDHIYSLPQPAQSEAQSAIRAIESEAMIHQEPQPGLTELVSYLERRGVRMALCTRNFDGPVAHLLKKFLQGKNFSPIVTREFRPPKPDPAGILYIAHAWGLEDAAQNSIMVGDSIDDMTAGRRAGAVTVLLVNPENRQLMEHEHTDRWIERLDDLVNILDQGF